MPPFRLLTPALPALFAFALCVTPPAASAENFSDGQRGEIESIVKNYLVSHPEVLEEAMAALMSIAGTQATDPVPNSEGESS